MFIQDITSQSSSSHKVSEGSFSSKRKLDEENSNESSTGVVFYSAGNKTSEEPQVKRPKYLAEHKHRHDFFARLTVNVDEFIASHDVWTAFLQDVHSHRLQSTTPAKKSRRVTFADSPVYVDRPFKKLGSTCEFNYNELEIETYSGVFFDEIPPVAPLRTPGRLEGYDKVGVVFRKLLKIEIGKAVQHSRPQFLFDMLGIEQPFTYVQNPLFGSFRSEPQYYRLDSDGEENGMCPYCYDIVFLPKEEYTKHICDCHGIDRNGNPITVPSYMGRYKSHDREHAKLYEERVPCLHCKELIEVNRLTRLFPLENYYIHCREKHWK